MQLHHGEALVRMKAILVTWTKKKKKNWKSGENCSASAGAERLEVSVSAGLCWTSLLVTHVPKYFVEPGPQSMQKHPRASRDYPGTQTLSILPPEKLALSSPHWEAKQQRQLCLDDRVDVVELAQLSWRGRNRPTCTHRGASQGDGFSFGCRTHFQRQLKDSWPLVLLVLFQPESAGISSQISCV